MRHAHQGEEALAGGIASSGLLVRVDDLVHGPQAARSRPVHPLLQHFEGRNVDGAPRFLREDAPGRGVVSDVEGQAAADELLFARVLTSAAAQHAPVQGRSPSVVQQA